MTFDYGLYSPGRSFIHSLDPRTKMLWLLLALGFSILNDQTLKEPLFGTIIYTSLITGIIMSKVPKFWLKVSLALSGVFFLTNFIFWPIYFTSVGVPLFQIPIINLVYTDAGIRFGLTKAFLVANPIMASVILFTTTKPYYLLQALDKLRFPYKFAFILILALRLISLTVSEVRTIAEAQMTRGLELQKGFIKRIRNHVPVFIPLMVRMIRGIMELATSLESKGFGYSSKRAYLDRIVWKTKDMLFTILIASFYVTFYLLFSVISLFSLV